MIRLRRWLGTSDRSEWKSIEDHHTVRAALGRAVTKENHR